MTPLLLLLLLLTAHLEVALADDTLLQRQQREAGRALVQVSQTVISTTLR